MERHWYDERFGLDDAPEWYTAEEAGAWAAGWNAAVRAFNEEFEKNRKREMER